MKKQYIILDSNSQGPRAVHAVLAYAEACRFSGFADVKLVVTPMLRAEFDRSHELHMKHFDDIHNRNKQPNKKSNLPKKNDDLGDVTISEMLEAYADYTVQPPPSEVEQRIQHEIADFLGHIHKHNLPKFYDIIDTPLSIINPARELPQMMTEDPAFFSQAFNACMKHSTFRDRMAREGLDKHQADKSIVAWYKTHAHSEQGVDILLGSSDRELVKDIKAIHERHYVTPGQGSDNLFHYGQQGLARHLKGELAKITVPSKQDDYSTHIALQTAKELCRIVIYSRGVDHASPKDGRAS